MYVAARNCIIYAPEGGFMRSSQRYYHKTRACAFAARAVYTGFASTLIAGLCTFALQTPALASSTSANAITPPPHSN